MSRKKGRLNKKTLTAAEITLYAEYLRGNRIHSQPRKAPPAYKEKTSARIVPFGVSPVGTNFTRVTVTRGALGILGVLGTVNLDGIYGLNLTTGATKGIVGFYPALARITLIPTTAVAITTGTSAFTGRPRNYRPGRSGSIPFGRGSTAAQQESQDPAVVQPTIADIDYIDAVAAIKSSVDAANYTGSKRVSFEPEVFRVENSEPNYGKAPVAPVP